MSLLLSDSQTRAIEAGFERCVIIDGDPGSGKTTVLLARAERARNHFSQPVAILTPAPMAVSALLDLAPPDLRADVGTVAGLAVQVLASLRQGVPLRIIDDVDAATAFARAAAPLLALEWPEFVTEELDPEVPGLRSPQRFIVSVFRLIRKLRDAEISPEEFLRFAHVGATNFYAKPPNLDHTDLLLYTKNKYRDSLHVGPAELAQQHRREIDLAKIIAKLYRGYASLQSSEGILTERDAVAEATRALQHPTDEISRERARYAALFVDDAQELTQGELQFLQALFGAELRGATLAADERSAINTFGGARPERIFALTHERFNLGTSRRSPPSIDRACAHLLAAGPTVPAQNENGGDLQLFRASSQSAEAAHIAEHVVGLIHHGAAAEQIALIFRSVRSVRIYEDALLARGIFAYVAGDVNVFEDPRALDALALLWTVADPFRHAYLLRTLSAAALNLSDASLAILCAEPSDPQATLFELEDEPLPTEHPSRWSPKRALRLGWNVLRGDQDAQLSAMARERIQRFRSLREGWLADADRASLPDFAVRVWSQGLAAAGAPDSAKGRAQRVVLERLLERLAEFAERMPGATLLDILEYAAIRSDSDLETCEEPIDASGVRLLSIEATRGRSFDHVVVPNVRPGAFPLWYVPDAFLFSPKFGMIPKDNVGDGIHAARTAKFTYYMFKNKTNERYNKQERVAFAYALRRARHSALVSASEKPTSGRTAPEFLEELRAARLPGVRDRTNE